MKENMKLKKIKGIALIMTADNAVIPAGTKLTLYRTDGSSLVDLKAGDTLYRIEVDHSEWPYTINGVEEEEYFDGIMYGG